MITYTKNIIAMKTELVDELGNVVRFATYYIYGTQGSVGSSRTVEVKLGQPEISHFIQLDDLKLEDVLGWVDSEISIKELEDEIAEDIYKNSLTKIDFEELPWNKL